MLKSAKMHAQNNILHNCFLWSKFSMKKLTFLHQKSIVKKLCNFLTIFFTYGVYKHQKTFAMVFIIE